MIASGTYKLSDSYVMKNHVALVGGFTGSSGNYDRAGETRLDGDGSKRVFDNDNNDLSKTALFYGMTVTNGSAIHGGGMYNKNASPTLINVIFSDNAANKGSGMYDDDSFSTLNSVSFSGNTANNNGGGIYNYESSPTLINVTFSGNTGKKGGDGIGHDGNGEVLTLINTILWENNSENIYVLNDTTTSETINLYYSFIGEEEGTNGTFTGIRYDNDTDTTTYPVTITTYPISINEEEIINGDPLLGTLADNGGGINTISIGGNSPVKDKGVYVKQKGIDRYYSIDNIKWFSYLGLNSLEVDLPNDTDDLTATDARGYNRIGRPDMGAYGVGGAP